MIETRCDSAPVEEDLQDEYYTTTTTSIDKITQEDEDLARFILDSELDPKVLMSIFVYKDKIRRRAISQAISDITNRKAEQASTRCERRKWRDYWISESYTPQMDLLNDLCHLLIYDENVILSAYLGNFFPNKNETGIIIAMVLIKDLYSVITKYDECHWTKFKEARKDQRNPFENMLRVWVRENREPIEKEEILPEVIKSNADALKAEQENCGWHENRKQIQVILMKKSIKFARLVIEKFEKANGDKSIEDIITANIEKHDLNKDLADAFSSLARYIKDKYKYIAFLLDKYSDGLDGWATWMMCVAVVHPQERPKIDKIFKEGHKGDSLSKFIVQKMACDKVMAEAIAVLIDPKFKPTTFSEKLDGDDAANATPSTP